MHGVRSSGFVSSGVRRKVLRQSKGAFFLENDPACEITEKDGGACALIMVPAFGRSFSSDIFFLLKSCAPFLRLEPFMLAMRDQSRD